MILNKKYEVKEKNNSGIRTQCVWKVKFWYFFGKKTNGEIISAKEMKGVPHHCLDIANPKKIFTAYDYKQCARKAMQKIWNSGKIPIIVGGTGFYIDAAIGRMELSNIPPNPKLRKGIIKEIINLRKNGLT